LLEAAESVAERILSVFKRHSAEVSAKKFAHYALLVVFVALSVGVFWAASAQPAAAVVAALIVLELAGFIALQARLAWTPSKAIKPKDLRIFSAALCFLMTVIAWGFLRGPEHPYFWPVQGAGLAILVLGMAFPPAVRPIHALWTPPAEGLMWLLTRGSLIVVYFLPVLITGVIMRMLGRDPLDRGFDKNAPTYWRKREKPADNSAAARFERYRRQF
jgi:hypothetical protein